MNKSRMGLAPTRVRWVIVVLLACLGLISYVERINLTVIARFIRDEFKLSDVEIGWTFSIFLFSYTVAQVPSGILVDRYGPRRVLASAALFWFIITLALGIFVGQLATTAAEVMVSLLLTRLLLGLAEAPTYPGCASAIARWFPSSARGMPIAIIQSTAYAGDSLTLILMATLTAYLGWRNALFASAVPALLLAGAWWRFGSDAPETDSRVSTEELLYIQSRNPEPITQTGPRIDAHLLRSRNVICLSLAYLGHGYVSYLFFFWFYIYLVDARHFSIAGGGVVGALPTLAAAICAFGGGPLTDTLARWLGPVRGPRLLVVYGGFLGGAGILIGAFADEAWLAIASFTASIGSRGLVESGYWASVNHIGGRKSGMVGGAMNAMGNLGGIISTALAPILVAAFGWQLAMATAAAVTSLSAFPMFGVAEPACAPNRSR